MTLLHSNSLPSVKRHMADTVWGFSMSISPSQEKVSLFMITIKLQMSFPNEFFVHCEEENQGIEAISISIGKTKVNQKYVEVIILIWISYILNFLSRSGGFNICQSLHRPCNSRFWVSNKNTDHDLVFKRFVSHQITILAIGAARI